MSRKRLRSILVAMAALVWTCPGQACAAPAPAKVIEEDAAGSTVTLCRGQKLTVRLRGNPTTGFIWEKSAGADAVLAQLGEPQFAPDSRALGAGGIYSFSFQASAVGSAPLKFIYHRPFESVAASTRIFEVTIEVGE